MKKYRITLTNNNVVVVMATSIKMAIAMANLIANTNIRNIVVVGVK